MFKIGDYVRSKDLQVEGVVNWTGICWKSYCMEPVLTLEKKDNSGVISEYHQEDFKQIQRVWRTFSEIKIGSSVIGYYVWEVIETVGEAAFINSDFKCSPQGGYVLAFCNYYHTRERAEKVLNQDDGFDQKIIIIPEKKED